MIWLLFAHALGDYALQTCWVLKNKGRVLHVLIGHCLVWTACVGMTLGALGVLRDWKLIFLFFGHFIIDKWKLGKKVGLKDDKYNWIDQLLHLVQLGVVAW